jgi:hypothetical protein
MDETCVLTVCNVQPELIDTRWRLGSVVTEVIEGRTDRTSREDPFAGH